MVTLMLLAGACSGAGVWLVGLGLRPPRVPLATALAALQSPATVAALPPPPDMERDPWDALGEPLVRVLGRLVPALTGVPSPSLRADLRVLERSPQHHLCQKALTALAGWFLPILVAGALLAGGAAVPVTPFVVAALAGLVGGWFVPDGSVRTEAAARRSREFEPALATFVDLVAIALAAGAGIEEGLDEAARTGTGWAFAELSRALAATRYTSLTPWQALTQLGEELGVVELREIGASVGLAGQEGAPVRRSLAARAESMRERRRVAADATSRRATDLMSFPVVLLAVAFMAFLAYPSLSRVLGL